MRIHLAGPTDVFGFRKEANQLLAHQVPPADIDWEALTDEGCNEAVGGAESRPPPFATAFHSIIPRSFMRLTELVALHRDAGRFDLMYRLLWRLVHEPQLALQASDPDMALVQSMAHGVRRDVFKSRAALRWRTLDDEETPLHVACCAPRHHITEDLAQWLTRFGPAQPWLLATPDRAVLWNGIELLCGPGVPIAACGSLNDDNWHALALRLRDGRVVPAPH